MSAAPSRRIRPAGIAGPIVLALLAAALVWAAGDRMRQLEAGLYDALLARRPARFSDDLLLVSTGRAEETADAWADPRLPRLVERLGGDGAALVVPTMSPAVLGPVPDLGQLSALLRLEERAAGRAGASIQALSEQLASLQRQYESQDATIDALARFGKAVVALAPIKPGNLTDSGARTCGLPPLAAELDDPALAKLHPARELLALPERLCNGVAGAGYAGFRPDPDGVIRETSLVVRSGDTALPTLALAAAAASSGAARIETTAGGALRFGGRRLAAGEGFGVLLQPYGADTPMPMVNVDALLAGDVPAAHVAGRIVLIGPDGFDRGFRMAGGAELSRLRMVATGLSNLLEGDYLQRPGWLRWAELGLLAVLGLVFVALVPGMSLNAAALAALFLATLLLTAESYLLLVHGIWAQLAVASLYSLLGIAAIAGLGTLRGAGPLALPTPQPVVGVADDELDLAFSVLRQQAPNDDTKERLYRIAVAHGKRREYAKAERVLRYLASVDPGYRNVDEKLKKLSGARAEAEAAREGREPAARPAAVPKSEGSGPRRTLGRYEVERVLGRGAMATVYLGRDPKINRKVAIKTIALAEEFSEEDLQAAKEQFLREAESAGRLNHPNIIAIYDVGEDDDVAYLAMEYFEGKALSHYAQQGHLLPPHWVLELGARAAEALHYAHSQKVVHRDIKPANVLYDAGRDELKLTDFGIARLTDTSRTKTGIILGTPSYMSPEQLSGNAVTGQSDLYSLGITMYHLLVGAPPFRADSIPKLMDKIVNEKHARLATHRRDVPASVDEIFDALLAKDPADRFPNGRALALALRDCCSSFDR